MPLVTHGMEERLSSLLRNHARDELATLAVETYGSELHGFLVHVIGEPVGAAGVFAQMIEELWRELPGFAGGCSVRTWLYRLAHQAAMRHVRSPSSGAPPRGGPAQARRIAATHTMTASGRADTDDRWRALRSELAPEDRALLVLRIDRDLAWHDIAQIMRSDSPEDAGAVTREAARLRQRFGVLKDQLRVRARAAGLR